MRVGFLMMTTFCMATSTCILPSPLTLQLILEFAKWRLWDQIVLFDNLSSLDCVFAYTRPLFACLAEKGISVSIQSAINPNIPDALIIRKHRIGSIVLLDGLNLTSSENVLHVNVNDSSLRELYIRAFNNRESRLDTTSGLTKAVQGQYGFFVSATLARRALRTTLIQERCTLKELPLPQTFTMVALPMGHSCPRITERMLPEMPHCKSSTTFHSARLADVYSAFFILIAGGLTAISIWIAERIWDKRRQMKNVIVRRMRQRRLMSNLSHLAHLSQFHRLHLHPNCKRENEHRANDKTQRDLTKPNENFATDSLSTTQHLRTFGGPLSSKRSDEFNVNHLINRPSFESRFQNRQANYNKSKLSELLRTKYRRDQKNNKSGDGTTVFPFHE